MAFKWAEATLTGVINSGTITTLSPAPTYVDYPTNFVNEIRVSKDGNPVIQSPLKDSRVRRWIWKGYYFDTKNYTTVYNQLLNLHYKLRLNAIPAKSEWIYLFEDVTDNLINRVWNGTSWTESATWVRVKVVDVTQKVASKGGKVQYDETSISFIIDDPNWNDF